MERTGAEQTRPQGQARQRISTLRWSVYVAMLLTAAAWGFILLDGDSGFGDLFRERTWQNAGRFVAGLAGAGTDGASSFAQPGRWLETGRLALNTLAMSVLAMGIAGGGALALLMPGARTVSDGTLGGSPSRAGRGVYAAVRVFYMLTRAIPELVWAMLIVFFLSPGILPGALALGIHNLGIVGRLTSEVVENLDPAPARALRAAGASGPKVLLYGVFPQALPMFLTFLLYRWEVVIRTTVVVGFLNAGGLGREFRLRMSWFHYDEVGLLLAWYLLLVVAVDVLSAQLRRRVRWE
ncbi:MAG: ABC transporter permease subunit [Chloroflexi bacterium]|nr:ABC transporter permease subunit [Chloroflexota bacterium]MYD48162.1 ABC transporter permease subunit [Chloroflexota bacterium]